MKINERMELLDQIDIIDVKIATLLRRESDTGLMIYRSLRKGIRGRAFDLRGMSRLDAFEFFNELNEKHKNKYKAMSKKIKRKLFDCVYCADAITETVSSEGSDWDEKEFLKKDCGQERCLYYDYFYKQATKGADENEKLINLLKNL